MRIDSSLGTCVQNQLGDACVHPVECSLIANAICMRDNRCGCNVGWFVAGGGNCRRRRINDACNVNVDCNGTMAGSVCTTDSVCACSVSHRALKDQTGCERIMLSSDCVDSADCMGAVNGSWCKAGTCRCLPTHDQTMPDACAPKGYNSTCSQTWQCASFLSNFICDKGYCACALGYRYIAGERSCLGLHLGDNCLSDAACSRFNVHSECGPSGSCICKAGFIEIDRMCGGLYFYFGHLPPLI